MQKVKCILSYDGTGFHGFARQRNLRTVQGEVERVMQSLWGCAVETFGASRTDSGVHARCQALHFVLPSDRIPVTQLPYILRHWLPQDIVLVSAIPVGSRFHARHDALWKQYRYTIDTALAPDIFARRFALHERRPLDLESMRTAAAQLEGEHDFTSFCAARAEQVSKVRTVYAISLSVGDNQQLYIDIAGNGFLHNMVRIIVGTLLQVGLGARAPDTMTEILARRDRRAAGFTAPAHGLCLTHIAYPAPD